MTLEERSQSLATDDFTSLGTATSECELVGEICSDGLTLNPNLPLNLNQCEGLIGMEIKRRIKIKMGIKIGYCSPSTISSKG